MKKHKGVIFLFSMLLAVTIACNLPSATPTPAVNAVHIVPTGYELPLLFNRVKYIAYENQSSSLRF